MRPRSCTRPRRPSWPRPARDAPARGVIARGLGRAYGDAAQNAGGLVVDATGVDGILAFDREAGVIRVSAGTSLDELLRVIVPAGWFVPVTPGTRFVTIGGAIAADIHGKNHHADGTFCAHVQSMVLASPDGATRTLTPAGTPAEFWATCGGMGLTGTIVEATFSLRRIETSRLLVDTDRVADLDDLLAALRDAPGARPLLGRVGRPAWRGAATSAGRCSTRATSPRSTRSRPGSPATRWRSTRSRRCRRRARPTCCSTGCRSSPSTSSGSARRRPTAATGCSRSPASSTPSTWSRAGTGSTAPRGFLQWQCLLPFGEERVLRRCLEALSAVRAPSFLAVLKTMGAADPAPLSFPGPGWTLALDVPAGSTALADVLDQLDRWVVDAGGRLYLAKDSRGRPELVPAMYPRLDEWRAVRDELDPERRITSDLARRLRLIGP